MYLHYKYYYYIQFQSIYITKIIIANIYIIDIIKNKPNKPNK